MPNKLFLFRHGELEKQYQNKFIGSTDAPLSKEGKEQIIKFQPFIREHKNALFLYSPLQRAVHSFQLATQHLNVRSQVDDNLREIDFGSWEGCSFQEIQTQFPKEYDNWKTWNPGFVYPQGEGHQTFTQRIKRCADNVRALQPGTIIVFSHGGVIMFLICELLGMEPSHYRSFKVRRGSRTIIDISNQVGVLEEINFIP